MCKHIELRYKEHMWYDGMSGGMVNQDGKNRWYLMMQSMSKPRKKEKTMPKALASRKLMIASMWCMMFNDVLNLLILDIGDHNEDKEHVDIAYGMDGHLV